jgi:hypothetical protein
MNYVIEYLLDQIPGQGSRTYVAALLAIAYGFFLAYSGEPQAGGAVLIMGVMGLMGRASITDLKATIERGQITSPSDNRVGYTRPQDVKNE